MTFRVLIAAALAALFGACASVRPMTQNDREATSRKVAEKATGTVLTEGELFQMDLDRTFVCEVQPQVGSHIPRYQCRSLRRVAREREVARAFAFNDGQGASKGAMPAETASTNASLIARELMATNRSKVVKEERAANGRSLPTPDQDPRFPPL